MTKKNGNGAQLKANAGSPLPSTIRNVERGILTSGDCAFFCRVAPRTINTWCDANVLSHYRIPNVNKQLNEGDRRVLVKDLVDFMVKRKMPLHPLLMQARGIWCVEFNTSQIDLLSHKLSLISPRFLSLIQMFGELLQFSTAEWLILGPNILRNQRQDIIDMVATRVSKFTKIVVLLADDEPEETKASLIKDNRVWHQIELAVSRFHLIDWDKVAVPDITGRLILTESKSTEMEVA